MESPIKAPTSDTKPATGHKRMRLPGEGKVHDNALTPTNIWTEPEQKKARSSSKVNTFSHPFAVSNRLDEIKSGEYGSVTDDIKALLDKNRQVINSILALRPQVLESDRLSTPLVSQHVSGLKNAVPAQGSPVIIIDSDDEEPVVDIQIKRFEETSCSQKQKLIESHEDDNDTKKVGDIYLRMENEILMEHKHHMGSNFAKIICGKEISDNKKYLHRLRGSAKEGWQSPN